MRIGEAVRLRILELCRERNLSVNKLSGMCGLTQSTLNNIVSGRNNSATVATIALFQTERSRRSNWVCLASWQRDSPPSLD